LIDRWTRPGQRWPLLLWAVPVVLVAIALALRPYHALTAPEAAESSRVLATLRPLQPVLESLEPDCVLAGARESGIALLLTRCGVLYEEPYTAHSSMIKDQEVHERGALNAWLQGIELADYARGGGGGQRFQVGLSDEPKWQPQALSLARAEIFQQIQEDPTPFLERYHPDTLLLPATAPDPERGGPWRLIQRTTTWSLWSKQPIER
jgi:hypothetical protein